MQINKEATSKVPKVEAKCTVGDTDCATKGVSVIAINTGATITAAEISSTLSGNTGGIPNTALSLTATSKATVDKVTLDGGKKLEVVAPTGAEATVTELALSSDAAVILNGGGKFSLTSNAATQALTTPTFTATGNPTMAGDVGKNKITVSATTSGDAKLTVGTTLNAAAGISGTGTVTVPSGSKLTFKAPATTTSDGASVTPTLDIAKGGTVDASDASSFTAGVTNIAGSLKIKAKKDGTQANYVQDIAACGSDGTISIALDIAPDVGKSVAVLNYDPSLVPSADRAAFKCNIEVTVGSATSATKAVVVTAFPTAVASTTVQATSAPAAGRRLLADATCTYAVWNSGSLETAQGPCYTGTTAPANQDSASGLVLSATVLLAVAMVHVQ